MNSPSCLTEPERQSLRNLRVPRKLQEQISRACQRPPRHETSGNPFRAVRDRLRRLFFDSGHIPALLQGKRLYRLGSNPNVLLVVGEEISLAHLPGWWTIWRANGRTHFQGSPRNFSWPSGNCNDRSVSRNSSSETSKALAILGGMSAITHPPSVVGAAQDQSPKPSAITLAFGDAWLLPV